jgi:hypothetical protein
MRNQCLDGGHSLSGVCESAVIDHCSEIPCLELKTKASLSLVQLVQVCANRH